jgi:hypothetical protein
MTESAASDRKKLEALIEQINHMKYVLEHKYGPQVKKQWAKRRAPTPDEFDI